MSEQWKECKLGDFVDITNGFAFKSTNFLEIPTDNALPVLKIKNVANGDANIDAVQYHEYYDSLKKYLISYGDILIALTGNHPQAMTQVVGQSSRYKLNQLALLNQRVAKIESKNNMSKDYLYYFLKDSTTHDYLASHSSGSANQANISKSDIENLDILLPPLPEQKAIAAVLSGLDDKIDLLHRQNKTLESMAEALFRQWFVEEADESWEEKPLDFIANYLNGIACQKYPPKNEIDRIPVLKIKELKGGFTENSDWSTTDIPKEYIIQSGDVIFSWSGSLVVKIWNGTKCVLNQHLFKVTSEYYPKWFYYFWTKHHIEKFISIAESKATTMGHIKREDLSSSFVLIPSKNEMTEMDKTIFPMVEKIILNNRQIHELEKMKDNLLPNLINGSIRVRYE